MWLDSAGLDFAMMNIKIGFCLMEICIKEIVMETAIRNKDQSITDLLCLLCAVLDAGDVLNYEAVRKEYEIQLSCHFTPLGA